MPPRRIRWLPRRLPAVQSTKPISRIGNASVGTREEIEQGGVVEPELISLCAEVHVQEIGRVAEIARPAEEIQLGLAALD